MTEKKRKDADVDKAAEEATPLKPPLETGEGMLVEEENDNGFIKISESVIAAVVRKYTLEVDGVVRFANQGIGGALAGMISKRNYDSSMVVEMDDDSACITVTLVIEFGVRIPDVAQVVQDVIRTRVEELTGKHVSKVNVIVHNLEDGPTVGADEGVEADSKPE